MPLTQAQRSARFRALHPESYKRDNARRMRKARISSFLRRTPTAQHPFLAYDGEAIEGRYALLSNTRDKLIGNPVISTQDALDFLWQWYEDMPIRMWFSGEYDITEILIDAPSENLTELWHTGETTCFGYHIKHIPRRIFSILKVGHDKHHARTYYDGWGFFQSSFIKTMEAYESGGLVLTDEERDLIEWGKLARTGFTWDMLDKVIAYNDAENHILERIMGILRRACNDVGWPISQWYGPGALADLLLRELEMREHRNYPLPHELVNYARFGGRIELFKRGVIDGPLYYYDINSAYPNAICYLPSMLHPDRWHHYLNPQYREGAFGLYEVEWELPKGTTIGPFPYRLKDGTVIFPSNGKGRYHAVEVDAAIRMYGRGPFRLTRAWLLDEPYDRPFEKLIQHYFNLRRAMKANKNFSQIAIRLALNSAYGKLAQRVGAMKQVNLLYAGFITAYTRAMLLDASRGNENAIIAFSTDGIVSTRPLGVDTGDALGEWEYHEYDGGEFYLPGVNRMRTGASYEVRNRGYFGLDFDTLADQVDGLLGGMDIVQHLFIPYRLAMFAPAKFGPYIGQFIDVKRKFDPQAGEKRIWLNAKKMPAFVWTKKPQASIATYLDEVVWSEAADSNKMEDELRSGIPEWIEDSILSSVSDDGD